MRPVALLCLALVSACVEVAAAQPRPDAGASTRRVQHPRREPRRAIGIFTALSGYPDGDASLGYLFGSSAGEMFRGGLGQPLEALRDGGAGGLRRSARDGADLGGTAPSVTVRAPPAERASIQALRPLPDGGSAAMLGALLGSPAAPSSIGGLGAPFGAANNGGPRGRFVDLAAVAPLARQRLAEGLARAEARASRCLDAAGHAEAVEVPVRFVVRSPTIVEEIDVRDASELVARCVREGIRFLSPTPPGETVEVVGWFRAAARTR